MMFHINEDNVSDISSVGNALLKGNQNFGEIQQILQSNPSSVKKMEDHFLSSLYIVLRNPRCSVDLVKLVLSYGADPNFETYRTTPLFLALGCRNRVGIIRALVEGGARDDQPNVRCLSRALSLNAETEIIKLLLSAGADLYRTDFSGDSPIFCALNYFNVGAFKSILDLQDVDINTVRNKLNRSLLHNAVSTSGCTADFVKFLIDRGLEVNSVDKFGNTPLYEAVRNPTCHLEVVDVLLRAGSRASARNRVGDTALNVVKEMHIDPYIVLLVLKYCLLEKSFFYVKDWISGHDLQGMFLSYANDCQCELQRMRTEHVGNGRTLFEFLQTFSGKQISKNGAEGFEVDQLLLRIIADNRYPLYSNVISSKLERSLLKDKLEECSLYTVAENRTGVTRKISLKHVCTRVLASYLDDDDLLSMIVAFSY